MICSVTNNPHVFGKIGNNRSKREVRGFLFCGTENRFYFFNEISDLFGIKWVLPNLGYVELIAP